MNAQTQPPTIEGTAVEVIPTKRPTEIRVVTDAIAVLDTARFEHMQRIASVMAKSNLIPDGLCVTGAGDAKEYLPIEQIVANCFLVVNQAVRWGMDPFAVTQCVSVVHGKLCYEGKLIAAVLEAKLGVQLEYEISGQGDAMAVVVSAAIDGRTVLDSQGRPKTVSGTVSDWKTTGAGSPWAARGGHPRMLRYRGAREWARVHAPGLMLGVYSDDEMADLSDDARANRARNVTPAAEITHDRPKPPNPTAQARPKPPNPMGEQKKPEEKKPTAAEQARDATIADIAGLGDMADCFKFAQGLEAKIALLPAKEQGEVRVAFEKHQETLNRD